MTIKPNSLHQNLVTEQRRANNPTQSWLDTVTWAGIRPGQKYLTQMWLAPDHKVSKQIEHWKLMWCGSLDLKPDVIIPVNFSCFFANYNFLKIVIKRLLKQSSHTHTHRKKQFLENHKYAAEPFIPFFTPPFALSHLFICTLWFLVVPIKRYSTNPQPNLSSSVILSFCRMMSLFKA